MGTTGRFGGGGGAIGINRHHWYDTDYTELYIGLAVVIGFFLILVLFLLLLFIILYVRRKCCTTSSQNQQRMQNMVSQQYHKPNGKLSTIVV